MAFQKEMYKARPKRTADGAVNARYTRAKKKEDGGKNRKDADKDGCAEEGKAGGRKGRFL